MSDFKPRKCPICVPGTIMLAAKPGRLTRYKTFPALPIPADLPIPTCDSCGEEWIDEATAVALDKVLSAIYMEEIARIKADLSQPDCRRCEDILTEHLSPFGRMLARKFIVCSICGNKRCPKATDHNLECTGSNASGQPGSDYE